jgi:hypothetical protein
LTFTSSGFFGYHLFASDLCHDFDYQGENHFDHEAVQHHSQVLLILDSTWVFLICLVIPNINAKDHFSKKH